jgi:hypothetical protein
LNIEFYQNQFTLNDGYTIHIPDKDKADKKKDKKNDKEKPPIPKEDLVETKHSAITKKDKRIFRWHIMKQGI